jgi:hypothetical protein
MLSTAAPPGAVNARRGLGITTPKEWITLTTEPNDAGRGEELAAIDRDYPGWHAWPAALAGLVYTRRPRISPPLVVRAVTPDALRQAIEAAEQERGLR